RIGIGLDGIVDARVRPRLGEGGIIVAHDVEIEDKAWAVLASVAQEFVDTIGHRGIPTKARINPRRANELRVNGGAGRRWTLWRRHRFLMRPPCAIDSQSLSR